MDAQRARILLADLVGDPRLVIVSGKGGVGKSTIARMIARLARAAELRALVVSFDGFAPSEEGIEEQVLLADAVMLDYLETHGFGPLASRLVHSGVVDAVSTAIPGIRDLLVLGKIKSIVNSGTHDLVLVDAPASGHLLSLLTSPEGLGEIASDGPVAEQAREVLTLIRDHDVAGVVLVTLPEETPVVETEEVYATLVAKVGASVLSCVVNRMPSAAMGRAVQGTREAAATAYLARVRALASEQLEIVRDRLPVPLFLTPRIGLAHDGVPVSLELLGHLQADGATA
jgi:energy-coupling factor transporter ATP-binding protein EcfA2